MRLTDLSRRLRRNLALCVLVLGCAFSGVSCAGCLYGSVKGKQVCLICNVFT